MCTNSGSCSAVLKKILTFREINSDEYQDKFYLREKIQSVYTDSSDEQIYETMKLIKESAILPISKRKFVKLLSKSLNNN